MDEAADGTALPAPEPILLPPELIASIFYWDEVVKQRQSLCCGDGGDGFIVH
jgi:hypothetical protein